MRVLFNPHKLAEGEAFRRRISHTKELTYLVTGGAAQNASIIKRFFNSFLICHEYPRSYLENMKEEKEPSSTAHEEKRKRKMSERN